jgi:hypothetical protein
MIEDACEFDAAVEAIMAEAYDDEPWNRTHSRDPYCRSPYAAHPMMLTL